MRKVGECPHCGAPIYGKGKSGVPGEIKYTCECRNEWGKGIQWIPTSPVRFEPTWPKDPTWPQPWNPWSPWATETSGTQWSEILGGDTALVAF
jgi:hypothetical protein